MKKRKGSLLQRMLAVLLSAVLLAGTVENALPVSAWAKGLDEAQENVGGNTAETEEGSITAEEGKSEEGTDSDGHDGKPAADAGDAEDAAGAVNAADAEGTTDVANGANTVYAAGTVNLPDAADMPNAVTIAEDAGTANATWKVTLRVHGYDAGKWKGIKTSHNDKIEEISQSCEEKPGQGYTDFTYTFEMNMKASTGWEQFELYYNYGDSVAKIIRKTIIIGENGWEEVNVWPVRFMNDDKVFDIIYVGHAQGINRGPETSPEKSGYTFSGWVTSDGEPAFQDDEFMQPAWIWITGETNFYASWTHTHDLVLKDAKNAACTEAGNQAYYVCNICDQWFSDAAGTQEIMNHDSVVIPAAGHSYDISQWGYRWADGHAHKCQNCNAYDTVLPHEPGAAATETMPQTCTECGYELAPATGESHTHNYGNWQSDSTQHWKVCSCGDETDRGNHNFGDWVTDKEATATEAGTKHRVCQTCNCREEGTIPATGESHTHNYGDWQSDSTQHWKACSCGDETDRGNHNFGDWVTDKEATATETGTKHRDCQTCSYTETGTIPATGESHTHNYGGWQHDNTQHWKVCSCGDETDRGNHNFGDWVTDKEATAIETGTKHRDCQTCSYTETGTIPATGESHTHNYGGWQHDNTQHWKVCSCGDETDRGNHNFGDWITDKEATVTETGMRHKECRICHYRVTETIPAAGTDPGSGTVTPEVKPGANAPATNISTPTEELEDMLLTEEEKQQVQNGTNVRIVLEVQDAGSTVSAGDKENIKQALSGFTVGQYLNIDLYKLVGANRTDITETAKKIRIVITVPDSLKNTGKNRTRTFAVIRVHDGRAELLTDLDSSKDTITIETDRFSTYAIVYKDSSNGGNGGNGGNNGGGDNSNQNNADNNGTKPDSPKDDEPETRDVTPIELCATLSMIAGFTYLLLYFTDRRHGMTEETKKKLVSRLVAWGKRGGRCRRYLALAAIFVLLVYYHSIGKKTCVNPLTFCQESGILCIQNNSNCN